MSMGHLTVAPVELVVVGSHVRLIQQDRPWGRPIWPIPWARFFPMANRCLGVFPKVPSGKLTQTLLKMGLKDQFPLRIGDVQGLY